MAVAFCLIANFISFTECRGLALKLTTFAVKNLKFSVPEYGGCGDWCREVQYSWTDLKKE